MPRLSIIFVTWNSRDDLIPCLESIARATADIATEVIISDNGSTDDTLNVVRTTAPELDVRILDHGENHGFAAANNLGIQAARGEHILLLNPDTEVAPDAVENALRHLDRDPQIGVVGAKLLTDDGQVQVPCVTAFRTFWDELCVQVGLHHVFRGSRIFDRYRMIYHDFDSSAAVPVVSGAFMLIRGGTVREVGGLDQELFLYGEEEDYCRRAAAAGWTVFYAADVEVLHHGGTSSTRAGSSVKLHYYASQDHLTRKHQSPLMVIAFRVIRAMGLLGRLGMAILRRANGDRRRVLWQALRMQLGRGGRDYG